MALSNQDDLLLLIRCPSCGQRFKVGEDLRGRTVECGGCEHRFRINDEVIVRGKKFYPGERKDPRLNRFQRVPLAIGAIAKSAPSVAYADAPELVSFEPVSPQRLIAGIAGVAGMVLMALLLMFGASRGGMLDGMSTSNRLVMAGFTALLGIVMLVYANPRSRGKALMIGGMFAAALISLPFFFTLGSTPLKHNVSGGGPVEDGSAQAEPESDGGIGESEDDRDLRGDIGTKPLEDEIARLAGLGSSKTAVGLWIRDLREQYRMLVMDYIIRVTGADLQSHFYPRGNGDFLLVVTGVNTSLERLAGLAGALGKVGDIYPELSVVEVRINNDSFVEGPIEKLTDKNDPAFYELNKRELESVDLQRVSKAVRRLAEAEPKVYRNDISRKLISLLESNGVEFKGDVCKALSVWADEPGTAGEAALRQVRILIDADDEVPPEMVALIVKEKNPGVIPILEGLWGEDPTRWESLFAGGWPGCRSHLDPAVSLHRGIRPPIRRPPAGSCRW